MSQENVEIVRNLLEWFQHRDHERAFEFYDPEIEWDTRRIVQGPSLDLSGVFHGHEGVRAYWRQWLSAWSDLHFEIDDVRDAGDEVVALIHRDEQVARTGVVGQPDGGADARRLDSEVAAVRQERDDRRRPR